jgi:hypothetical protein
LNDPTYTEEVGRTRNANLFTQSYLPSFRPILVENELPYLLLSALPSLPFINPIALNGQRSISSLNLHRSHQHNSIHVSAQTSTPLQSDFDGDMESIYGHDKKIKKVETLLYNDVELLNDNYTMSAKAEKRTKLTLNSNNIRNKSNSNNRRR